MKDTTKFIFMVIVFMVLVVSMTFCYLFLHYKEKGDVNITKKYYDIKFINAVVSENIKSSVKINNDNDSFHVEIPNMNKDKSATISLDVINIGNISVYVDNYSITNGNTNARSTDFDIDVSLKKGELIKGGESKKVIVKVKYKGNNSDDVFYNFNVNYLFNKDKL